MTGVNKRRQSRSRQTKAQLIEELEGMESELAAVKLGQGLEGEPADGALPKSEEWLHAVFEHSPAAILLKAPDGRYLMANRTWHEWFNPNNEEIVGKTVYDFYSNEHAKKVTAYDQEIVKTGKAIRKEHTSVLSNGTELDSILHKFPIRGADGNIVAVSSINIDFSEKKRAEEALRQSENRLDEALQSLQQAFALYDADDRLIAFNEEYERLRPGAQEIMEKGGTFEDMIRKNVELEIIPEAYGREEEFIKERVKEHKNPKGTIIRRFKDGTWSRIEEVRTPSGGIALSFVDITDLKKAEEALGKSEALFRAVVDYSPTKIHIKDVEGRYILINKEAEKLFGISDEEGRGKTSYDLFSKEIADAFMAHDTAVIESGQATEGEEEFTIDESAHTYLTVKFPIYGSDGVTGVGAIGTDITERKRADESNVRLNTAISALSEGIALYDADDRLVFVNEQSRNFNEKVSDILAPGLLYEDLLRALIKKGLMPEAAGREEEWIKQRLDLRRNPGPPFEVQRQDGLWLRVREQRLADGGILTLTSDITEAKQAERALQDSESRFRGFAEVASDWFWEMGPDLRFSYFSERYAEITGFQVEDRIGSRRWDYVSPEQLETEAGKWNAHKADIEARRPFRNFEYANMASSEGIRYVSVSGQPVFDDDGAFLGYRGTGSDITERVRGEVALRAAKEEAEYANRSKTEFLANMSHELRTPLNSILGFSEVLMIGDLEKFGQSKAQEYAKDIHYSGSHLLSLINEVLDLSKLEVGEIGIAEDEIDVADVIKTCIKMLEGRSTDKKICLSTILTAGLPRLLVDELRFKQILINLLGNAVKFTPPGGEVTVSACVNGKGEYIIEVEDTGIGIAAGDISKVLEPFGQVHDILTRNHEGSGLGLHLAKSFTELHGGALNIESTPGEGTAVILTFPKERTVRIAKKRA